MSSKKQKHSNDGPRSKKSSLKPATKNSRAPRQRPPLTKTIQPDRFDLSSLTLSNMIQLQHAVGNRGVNQLLARNIQPRLTNHGQLTAIKTQGKQTIIQRKHILKDDRAQAIKNLKDKYPEISDSQFSKVTADIGEKFWDTYLKGTPFQQVIERILNGYLPDDQKGRPITVQLTEQNDPRSLTLHIEVKNHRATNYQTSQTQKTLFALNQVFEEEDGKLKVHIESVTATGGGKKLFGQSLLPLFESLQVKKLTLSASRIGGGDEGVVAWARYGFIPSQEAWNTMREHGRKEIRENREEWAQKVQSIVDKDSPRAIRELVLLSWQNRDKVKPLLDAMLRSTISWPGTLDLTNPQDRQWVEKYTSGADVEEFRRLLV